MHASASSLAELVSCAILTPAEVIKQNAQMVNTSTSTSTSTSTNATLQTLGKFRSHPLALWRGYAALAGRNLPFTAMHFPMFEAVKARIQGWRQQARGARSGGVVESAWITALSAGSAGAVAAVVTTPIDVVKTRIMLRAASEEGEAASSPPQGSRQGKGARKSGWQVGQAIVRERGIPGLWRGGALRAVWTFLGAGLYLGAYESGRGYLAARRGEDGEDGDEVE